MITSATATPAFVAAFVLLVLLLANVLWFTRFAWWVKGSAIVLVAGLFWMSWRAMPELLGWPAQAGIPPRFNVAGIQVIEPEKNGASKGAIYLWVTGFATVHGEVIPRAFEIPFTPELQLKLAVLVKDSETKKFKVDHVVISFSRMEELKEFEEKFDEAINKLKEGTKKE
jgi:hypothetical protein